MEERLLPGGRSPGALDPILRALCSGSAGSENEPLRWRGCHAQLRGDDLPAPSHVRVCVLQCAHCDHRQIQLLGREGLRVPLWWLGWRPTHGLFSSLTARARAAGGLCPM